MARSTSWWEQAGQNRLIALVLAMLVTVPLLASPLDHSIGGTAAFVFEGFSVILLACLLWTSKWNLNKERVKEFFATGANAPVMALLGLALISCVFATKKPYALQETLRLGAGILLYFVVAYQFRRSEQLTKLVDTIVFLAIGLSLIGFAQFATSSERYATGPFGDHQLFGSFLMLLLPILAVIAVTEKAQNRQIVAQVATVMTGASLLLAHSRSAWVGGAAGLAVLGMLALMVAGKKSKVAARKHEFALPVMLLVIAAGFFLLLSPDSQSIIGRAATFGNMKGEDGWKYRQQIWGGAASMVKAKPITGFGIGQYNLYAPRYTGVGIAVSNSGQKPTLDDNAHNFYLQTAAELGIPGIVAVLAALGMFWYAGLKRLRGMEAGIRRTLLIGAMASAVAFAIDAAASPSWQYGQLTLMLWAIMGAGVSCIRPHVKSKEAEAAVLPMRVTRPATVFATAAMAMLLPTAVCSADPEYRGYPLTAAITPTNQTITLGSGVTYTLTVKFSNKKSYDVSEETSPNFVQFSAVPSTGTWTAVAGTPPTGGPVLRRFTPSVVNNYNITGKYTQPGGPTQGLVIVSDTTPLHVNKK